jgi:homoserine kinase
VSDPVRPGHEVTVSVPATSANLGPGFDTLGLALSLRDEVRVRVEPRSAPPVTVHVEGEGAGSVPRDSSHLVVRALHTAYGRLAGEPPHLTLWCTNRVPHGRGLGSSAAAAVAGVLAAQALAGAAVDLDVALGLAAEIEGHPDNAAACLYGGLTIAWADASGPRAARLDTVPGLCATVFVPAGELATATARGLLPPSVPHADAAHSAGRAALLVAALTSRPDLLVPATEDRLHQSYRAGAMPGTAALVADLRSRGVAAVVSGAGPSVLALRAEGEPVPAVDAADGWTVLDLQVSHDGARVGPGPL